MMRTSLLFALIGMSFVAAYGQAKKENLEDSLQKAKDEYRSKIDEIEVKLILALEQRIESARKSGDKKTLDLATAERDQFKADGTLPKSVEKATQTFQRQSAAARKKLELIYRSQIKEYIKRSEDAKADALEAELTELGGNELNKVVEGDELILNGGFEVDLSAMENQKWVEVQGEWERRASTEPSPQEGANYIWAIQSPVGELMQEIDVSGIAQRIDTGLLKFEFSGYLCSGDGKDASRILLELVNAKKKTLDEFDSGELIKGEWQKFEFSRGVKIGTRSVRVRLISKKYNGNENNAYYDGLSLRFVPRGKSAGATAK